MDSDTHSHQLGCMHYRISLSVSSWALRSSVAAPFQSFAYRTSPDGLLIASSARQHQLWQSSWQHLCNLVWPSTCRQENLRRGFLCIVFVTAKSFGHRGDLRSIYIPDFNRAPYDRKGDRRYPEMGTPFYAGHAFLKTRHKVPAYQNIHWYALLCVRPQPRRTCSIFTDEFSLHRLCTRKVISTITFSVSQLGLWSFSTLRIIFILVQSFDPLTVPVSPIWNGNVQNSTPTRPKDSTDHKRAECLPAPSARQKAVVGNKTTH
jgi:hypothetical protein